MDNVSDLHSEIKLLREVIDWLNPENKPVTEVIDDYLLYLKEEL